VRHYVCQHSTLPPGGYAVLLLIAFHCMGHQHTWNAARVSYNNKALAMTRSPSFRCRGPGSVNRPNQHPHPILEDEAECRQPEQRQGAAKVKDSGW